MAAVDYFLKLDGIPGESKDTNFTGQIPLLSYSLGGEQSSSVAIGTGGHGAGKVTLHPFTVTKPLDKSSVPHFKSLTLGSHIATGTLSAVKAGANRKPYLKIDFKSMFVTSYLISAVDEHPVESITYAYETIKIEYYAQDDKGAVALANSASWNIATSSGS
jgi:type VI secretion system secreted protein Hcp